MIADWMTSSVVWHFVFAAGFGATAVLVYRTLRWSLDSPVLRAALRKSAFGWGTKAGIAAAVGIAAVLLYHLAGGQFSAAVAFFAGLFLLLASAAVLFCGFLLQDIRELFLYLSRRESGTLSISQWWRTIEDKSPRLEEAGCPLKHPDPLPLCHRQPSRCAASGPQPASWTADWRRSRQRR